MGTKGLVAGSPLGGLNVVAREGGLDVSLSPLEAVSDTLEVLDGDRVVFETPVPAKPLETWTTAVPVAVPRERLRVRIGHRLEWSGDPDAGALSRPLESPADFDWDSVYGLWLKGKEQLRQRSYGPAREALEACLKKDPHYVPALGDLALLRYRAMDYAGRVRPRAPGPRDRHLRPARELLLRPRGGEARPDGRRAGRLRAGRAVGGAARRRVDGARAAGAARRATSRAPPSTPSAASTSTCATSRGTSSSPSPAASAAAKDEAAAAVDALLALDPLSTFGRFEKALAAGGDAPRAFAAGLRGERPEEVLLELAAWYHGLGRRDEAEQRARARAAERRGPLLARPPEGRAGRPRRGRGPAEGRRRVPELVFPFRPESAEVLAWAASKSASWRPRYSLALVHWGAGNHDETRRLLEACGETPDFAPFYAARALALEDASRPRRRSPTSSGRPASTPRSGASAACWPSGSCARARPRAALETAAAYAARFPENYILGMLHAKALLANGRYPRERAKLARLNVIPYEGSIEGRRLYREAHLMLAVEALKKGDTRGAQREMDAARLWPENLGAGKPYPENVDERLEDFLAAQGLARRGRSARGERPPPEGRGLRRPRARAAHPRARARAEAGGPGGGGAQAPRRLVGARARERARGLGGPRLRRRGRSAAGGRGRGGPRAGRVARRATRRWTHEPSPPWRFLALASASSPPRPRPASSGSRSSGASASSAGSRSAWPAPTRRSSAPSSSRSTRRCGRTRRSSTSRSRRATSGARSSSPPTSSS